MTATGDGAIAIERTTRSPGLTFDPSDAAVLRDPHRVLAQLRTTDPVHWSPPLAGWVVTSYALVNEIVMNPDPFSADRLAGMGSRLPEPQRTTVAEVMRWLGLWMVFRDPPDHTRIRRHLAKVVSPQVLKQQAQAIEEITTVLLDGLTPGEPFDFYREFGLKLPGFVTMDLIGVPRDRLGEVKGWSDDMMVFIGSSRGVQDKYQRARYGAHSMAELFRELVATRRAEPRDDVLSTLIASQIEESVLSEDELVASMMMIANGAQETTAHLMSNALIALDRRPEAMGALRENPGLMTTAIDEFLRYDGPVLSTARLVARDTELGGVPLSAGERIFAILIAANRDPDAFEDPENLVLDRSPNRHVGFSKGAHFCLGAPLARLEAEIALRRILERYRTIEIAEPLEEVPWTNSMVARGPTRMPLRVC
jgi:cytochrome P450